MAMLLVLLAASAALGAEPDGYSRSARFSCQPSQVWDGDSFNCADGRKIRVAGIAAREVRKVRGGRIVDGGCSKGHPCSATSGLAARKALADLFGGARGVGPHGHLLVRGPVLQCRANGTTGDRVAAFCRSAATGDVSCRMVRGGYALRWARYWSRHLC